MGNETAIAWANSTFNPWVGCTKVGPGCDHCYAERAMDQRRHFVKWGAGQPRRRTSAANWKQPARWDRKAAAAGTRSRVFCSSLADVFDNEVEDAWRSDLWEIVERTPNLDWLLLTKRIGNVPKMLPAGIARLANVWLGITVVNQDEADRDIPKLLNVRVQGPRWLSMEPLLGPIRFPPVTIAGINWTVVGGESGPHARPMLDTWALDLRHQCKAAAVPFFFKQGSEANWPAFKDFASFPLALQVREFPR